jgi:hypothetical protein
LFGSTVLELKEAVERLEITVDAEELARVLPARRHLGEGDGAVTRVRRVAAVSTVEGG